VSTEDKYVAAAYLVVFVVVLVWVLIIATKVARLEREVKQIEDVREVAGEHDSETKEPAHVG
jgi:CcmD family protein